MRKTYLIVCAMMMALSVSAVDLDLQIFYDFGSINTACANQRTNRMTTTLEFFHPDNWGSTFAFVDFDYALSNTDDPQNSPIAAYWEISRALNFWKNTKAKDLSVHVEYNGGFGVYGYQKPEGGYGVNNTALVGLEYFLHTPNFKNTFTLQLLFKYIANPYNMYNQGHSGNQVPLQFTCVWACKDLFKANGLTFCGFLDIWGEKLCVKDRIASEAAGHAVYTDPTKQSFVFITEPQLWYSIGQWFKCPNLCIGTEIELSYNFAGTGFMCNPCVGIRWNFL